MLTNYGALEEAFSAGGDFAAPCLLEMLRAVEPVVHAPCPSAWMAQTKARLLRAPCLHRMTHNECYKGLERRVRI